MRTNPGMGSAVELVELFKKELSLCRLTGDETVLVYGDLLTPPDRLAACIEAAQSLGAQAVQLVVPTTAPEVAPFGPRTSQIERGLVLQAWMSADLVIDLVTASGQGFSQVMEQATQSGTRVVRVTEPVDVLKRLMPDSALKARTVAGGEVMGRAQTLRVRSRAGTDLTLDKADRPAMLQYGCSDEEGHWDHWPSGAVACAPLEDGVDGVLVLDTGDVLLPLGMYVSSPLRMTLEQGRIVEIQGDSVDAFLLRDWFASWEDPNAYVISHAGWGTLKGALWHRMQMKWMEVGGLCDVEFAWGGVTIAFGSNMGHGFMGRNDSRAHIDFCCLHCDFYLDDQQIVKDGIILPPDLR